MSNHTPGPWTIDGQYPLTEIAAVKSLRFSYRITAAPNGKDEEKEAEANTNLISSAPDFKSASEKCVEWLDLIKQSYPEMWSLIEGLTELKAAIKKAEGKSP